MYTATKQLFLITNEWSLKTIVVTNKKMKQLKKELTERGNDVSG
jgi:hypothetical protein